MVFENLTMPIGTDRSVIPAGCLSFSEGALYVAEASENEFNKFFESVGIDELAVFESTGTEVVYEGAKLDSFKKGVIDIFKGLLEKIKHAYEIIVDKFNEIVKGSKKNLLKVTESELNLLDTNMKFGKSHHFDFGGFYPRQDADSLANEIKDAFNKNKDQDPGSRKNLKEEYEGKIVSKISSTDKDNIKEAKEALAKKFNGDEFEVDHAWVVKNLSTLQKVVFNAPTKEIKKSFNEEKKLIDGIIGEVKKFKSTDVNYANQTVSLLKDITNTMHQCMMVYMDAMKRRYSEYRNIYTKAFIAIQKRNSQHESVDVEVTQQDLVESCFNWD